MADTEQLHRSTLGTSAIAGAQAARMSGSWRARILARLSERPSALWELAEHFGTADHCISGRITELSADLHIEPTGERREKPESGCPAEVWRIRRAQADRPADVSPLPALIDRDYPLSYFDAGQAFDRQEILPIESYPGIHYARRADTGGVRLSVRVTMSECPNCGKPLRLVGSAELKKLACGRPECGEWRAKFITIPGQAPTLAFIREAM